eukprot:SAG31_NODE_16981_length_688_cov_0.514431_1_plen_21_part_10
MVAPVQFCPAAPQRIAAAEQR